MDNVMKLFYFMRESTWMDSLCTYGMQIDITDSESVGKVLMELPSSTWAEQLYTYKPDIIDEGIPFMSVPDMRDIYVAQQ